MTQPQKFTKDMLLRIVKSTRESTMGAQMERDIDALDAMDLVERLNANNLVVIDTVPKEDEKERLASARSAANRQH